MAHRLPLSDIQFISDFAAFARSKGDEAYDGLMPSQCALAQFGYPGVVADAHKRATDRAERKIPYSAYAAAALHGGYTFSALADRLEVLLVDAPIVERGQ